MRALQNLHLAQSQISDIRLITEKRFGDPVSEYGMTFDGVLQSPLYNYRISPIYAKLKLKRQARIRKKIDMR
jgi:hypothetical protein